MPAPVSTPVLSTPVDTLAALRRRLAALQAGSAAVGGGRFSLGVAETDATLGGGLALGALHDILASGAADAAAAAGFCAALLLRASQGRDRGAGSSARGAARGAVPPRRMITWIRQDGLDGETGRLHAPGLAEFGLDPRRLLLVRSRDAAGALWAGLEAVRCPALAATVIELWGDPAVLDLTATRKLSLAAAASGVTTFLLRIAAGPRPSAAVTCWAVTAAASTPLPAGAPGRPAFAVTLLRHRGGVPGRVWHLEWNRDRHSFEPVAPLSRAVVPVPARRPAAAAEPGRVRQTG